MILGAGPIVIGEWNWEVAPRSRRRGAPPPPVALCIVLLLAALTMLLLVLLLLPILPAGQACEFDYSGTQACKALK
jgi:hypothetical protein